MSCQQSPSECLQVLEDEDFLPGEQGEEILEQFGEMLREGGFAKNDADTKAKCTKLAQGLGRFSMKAVTRALESGPIKLR